MCGIAGVFNLNKKSVSRHELKAMSDAIAHRGPDGEGFYIDEHFGMAHRRLAILDLSARANQPMQSKKGNWVISFNGCIYNYLELKTELQSKGAEFHTTSDTEVIVEGIEYYGIDFIEKLNGMFAIASWNNKTKKALFKQR